MSKLYYCLDCKRVSGNADECEYCKSSSIKELQKDSPVNVIGSKLKGRVLKMDEEKVRLLVVDESKNKFIKEYEPQKLRKVL